MTLECDTVAKNSSIIKILKLNGTMLKLNDQGYTPLIFAIIFGYNNWAKILIENRVGINQLDYGNRSPLHWAMHEDNYEIFTALVQNKAKVNFVWRDLNVSLLFQAASYKKSKYAEVLIRNGADVDMINLNDDTALHVAAEVGAEDIVEMLIKNFAKIDAKNALLETAIHLAADNGHMQVVEMLMNYGANFNLKDENDYTPLHMAVTNQHFDIVHCLIKYGANIELRNDEQNTPMEDGMQNDLMDVFKVMIFSHL